MHHVPGYLFLRHRGRRGEPPIRVIVEDKALELPKITPVMSIKTLHQPSVFI